MKPFSSILDANHRHRLLDQLLDHRRVFPRRSRRAKRLELRVVSHSFNSFREIHDESFARDPLPARPSPPRVAASARVRSRTLALPRSRSASRDDMRPATPRARFSGTTVDAAVFLARRRRHDVERRRRRRGDDGGQGALDARNRASRRSFARARTRDESSMRVSNE